MQVGRYVLQVERILARHSDWSNKQNMVQLPWDSTQKRLSLQSRRGSWLAGSGVVCKHWAVETNCRDYDATGSCRTRVARAAASAVVVVTVG